MGAQKPRIPHLQVSSRTPQQEPKGVWSPPAHHERPPRPWSRTLQACALPSGAQPRAQARARLLQAATQSTGWGVGGKLRRGDHRGGDWAGACTWMSCVQREGETLLTRPGSGQLWDLRRIYGTSRILLPEGEQVGGCINCSGFGRTQPSGSLPTHPYFQPPPSLWGHGPCI